jgi:hypothetical protein
LNRNEPAYPNSAVTFGIMTTPQQVSYRDILRVWSEAETVPQIKHAWLFDHLMPIGGDPNAPIFEGWTPTVHTPGSRPPLTLVRRGGNPALMV